MTLTTGTKLSHYEITSQIGKGGMGEVYQAKDQKLGRDVAIKVLPEEFAKDADRVARFQREAKLLASLNHPNIAAIHGLEEAEGIHFLVMELIEGQTLADRIKSSPIPVEEALKLALQITEALEAAHEKGVIHRDLKPANIKVTPDGKVKVLDFGLAKAFAGEQGDLNLSNSSTLSQTATMQGVILGTAAYMSPEQAKGKSVDKRTDIWAFGAVLYEMLTGRSAFQGDEVSEILASVIKGDTNLDLIPSNIHPRVREVINRCLQKDLRKRYPDIANARYEVEQVLADPSGVFAQPITTAESRTRLRKMLPWLAAALVLGGIIAGLGVWRLKPREPRPITRFSCILPADLTLISENRQTVAISPDGSRFVCTTNKGLYLRSMDRLQGNIIPGTEGAVGTPLFSPDGQWVAFRSRRDKQLKKIPISGGDPVIICDAGNIANALWSADNAILFDEDLIRIMQVSADGGIPEKIFEGENEGVYAPQLLPDGTNLLLTVSPTDRPMDFKIAVQSLGSGTRKELFAGQGARYLDTRHLVYVQGGNLFAVPFDADKIKVTGGHVPIIQDVKGLPPRYAVSDSGALVYVKGEVGLSAKRILVWVDRNGNEEAIEEAPPRAYAYTHLSPDGTRVALDIRDQESDIWIYDLARETLSRLTSDPAEDYGGIWTPDGTKVVYGRAGNIYMQRADGSGSPELLHEGEGFAHAFSPDGKYLLITDQSPYNIRLLSTDAGEAPKQLLTSKFNEYNAHISPDGRWIAYQSDISGSLEIYVRPFPNVNDNLYKISTEGGERPLWSENGRELFYFLSPGIMMSVPIETSPSFKAGAPKVLFKGEYQSPANATQYSVTPDGKRFLMMKDAAAKPGSAPLTQQINIVLNWFEELKERVPVE
jgi:serine/threonine protein kinase/Tol biopolymer transport system component